MEGEAGREVAGRSSVLTRGQGLDKKQTTKLKVRYSGGRRLILVRAAFTPGWDSLTTLENWVEKGIAPANQIVADTTGLHVRTRPLCEYPTWPEYNGYGDVDSASSFTCSEE